MIVKLHYRLSLRVGDCETWNITILDQITYCISDTSPDHILRK